MLVAKIKCCVCVNGQIKHIFECDTMKEIEAAARFLRRQNVSFVILFEGEFSNV